MKRINLILHLFIIIVFSAELISRWNGSHLTEYLTKPLLLPWIAFFFWLNTRGSASRGVIYLAFAFSWIGDMFLMLSHLNEMLFFAGVGGFFLAQLSYIWCFIAETGRESPGYLIKKPLWTLPFVIYAVLILILILDDMKGLMVPVITIYAVSLIGMSMAALNRKGNVTNTSFVLVFSGSVLFVISDSLIALNRFHSDIPRASFLIMLTYFTAQYLIMYGMITESKAKLKMA